MRELTAFAEEGVVASDQLTLPFELRQKSRLRARLDGGAEVALILPRGRVLRDGDVLRANDGFAVRVCASPEKVSTVSGVTGSDAVALARCAYHLGNRHVPVQIGAGFLRYQRDHVLDDMVRGLGLVVTEEEAPFEPEAGAYGEHEYAHGGGPGHAHGHAPLRAQGLIMRGGTLRPRPPHRGYDHGDGDES
jgi:urease accessory protein